MRHKGWRSDWGGGGVLYSNGLNLEATHTGQQTANGGPGPGARLRRREPAQRERPMERGEWGAVLGLPEQRQPRVLGRPAAGARPPVWNALGTL